MSYITDTEPQSLSKLFSKTEILQSQEEKKKSNLRFRTTVEKRFEHFEH
jgi:hypothetical protein